MDAKPTEIVASGKDDVAANTRCTSLTSVSPNARVAGGALWAYYQGEKDREGIA